MIATEEWKREVIKHESLIKELEKKYEKKCKTLKVCMGLRFDYCNATTVVTIAQLTNDMKCSILAYYLSRVKQLFYLQLDLPPPSCRQRLS